MFSLARENICVWKPQPLWKPHYLLYQIKVKWTVHCNDTTTYFEKFPTLLFSNVLECVKRLNDFHHPIEKNWVLDQSKVLFGRGFFISCQQGCINNTMKTTNIHNHTKGRKEACLLLESQAMHTWYSFQQQHYYWYIPWQQCWLWSKNSCLCKYKFSWENLQ